VRDSVVLVVLAGLDEDQSQVFGAAHHVEVGQLVVRHLSSPTLSSTASPKYLIKIAMLVIIHSLVSNYLVYTRISMRVYPILKTHRILKTFATKITGNRF
jgi:hypothetical protein